MRNDMWMGNTSKMALLAGVLASALAAGCMGTYRGQLVATSSPPPARVVVVDERPGYVWVDGRWEWTSDGWVWVDGTYVAEQPGFVWVQGTWVHRGHGWVYSRGHWRNHGGVVVRDHRAPVEVRDHRTPAVRVEAQPGVKVKVKVKGKGKVKVRDHR